MKIDPEVAISQREAAARTVCNQLLMHGQDHDVSSALAAYARYAVGAVSLSEPTAIAGHVRTLRAAAAEAQERAAAATQSAVTELMMQGLTARDIASMLGISLKEVGPV